MKLRVVLLVLLVFLAGCNATQAFNSGSDNVEIPETPEVTESDLPSSISQNGINSAFALAESHQRHLRNESFTVTITTQYTSSTQSWEVEQVVKVSSDRETFYSVINSSGEIPQEYDIRAEEESWFEDGRTFVRNEAANSEHRYAYYPEAQFVVKPTDFEFRNLIINLFDARESEVSPPVERNNKTMFWVTSSIEETMSFQTALISDKYEIGRNFSVVALVDKSGFVHEIYIGYDRYVPGKPVHVSMRIEYSKVGETNLQQPSWADEAKTRSDLEEGINGMITAQAVVNASDTVSNNLVVDYTDPRIRNVTALRTVLEEAIQIENQNQTAVLRLRGESLERTSKALNELPQGVHKDLKGYFIRYKGEVVFVAIFWFN